MNLIEKAQKDEPGRYRFRIFVEDISGIKSEKTMTTHVKSGSSSSSKTDSDKNKDTSTNSKSVKDLRQKIANFAKNQVGKKLEHASCKIFGKSKSQGGWCSEFVSYCAYSCGYTKVGVYPKVETAPRGVKWFKNHSSFKKSKSYTPKPGDVMFTGSPSHTCIVYKVSGKYVYTIDGGGSKVKMHRRKIGSSNIYGYGIPLFYKIAD